MSTPGIPTDERPQESRGFLRVLFDRAADAYFLIDLEGRIVDSNAAAQEMMGWRLDELIGRSALDPELHLVCPESLADVAAALGENAEGRASPPREYVLRHKDGSQVIAEVSSMPVTIEGRTLALGIARDMTERKRDARESEAKFYHIFESSPLAIALVEADSGRILEANSQMCALHGYTREELRGMVAAELCHSEDLPRMLAEIDDMRASGKALGSVEHRYLRKDGSVGWGRLSTTMIFLQGRAPLGLGITEDITERRRSEERLQQLQAQLAHVARVSTAGEMLAGIAHEISQPLFAIGNLTKACAGALAQPGADPARLRAWIGQIGEAVSRAGEIIRRVKSYLEPSRFDHRPARIVEVVAESIRLAMAEGRQRPIRVEQEPGSVDAIVEIDAIQIEQVLVNLLRNAIEAIEAQPCAGGKVSVRTEREGDLVRVVVSDDGPGVPRELCDRLFDPFVTTKPGGLGMGLAICRTIVEAHGGRIRAESVVPRGARFCFTLRVGHDTP